MMWGEVLQCQIVWSDCFDMNRLMVGKIMRRFFGW